MPRKEEKPFIEIIIHDRAGLRDLVVQASLIVLAFLLAAGWIGTSVARVVGGG